MGSARYGDVVTQLPRRHSLLMRGHQQRLRCHTECHPTLTCSPRTRGYQFYHPPPRDVCDGYRRTMHLTVHRLWLWIIIISVIVVILGSRARHGPA